MKNVYGLFFHRKETFVTSHYDDFEDLDEGSLLAESVHFSADDLIQLFETKQLAETYLIKKGIDLNYYSPEGYYVLKAIDMETENDDERGDIHNEKK